MQKNQYGRLMLWELAEQEIYLGPSKICHGMRSMKERKHLVKKKITSHNAHVLPDPNNANSNFNIHKIRHYKQEVLLILFITICSCDKCKTRLGPPQLVSVGDSAKYIGGLPSASVSALLPCLLVDGRARRLLTFPCFQWT